MANWIEGVKCIHQITCGLMVSLLLGLAIRSHINIVTSSTCDLSGTRLDSGFSKCEMTTDRYWTLGIFYSGAIIFALGSLATCMSNGYMTIFYVLCASVWVALIVGLSIYRMSSKDKVFVDAFYTITEEVILDKWEIWSTVVQWALAITFVASIGCALVMVFHFLQYKHI